MRWSRKSHIRITEQARQLDKELLDGLERMGFKLDFGEDGTGWQFMYLTRGGGYYFNVGCSDLIVDGEIGLVQFSDIAEFVADGARMQSGETLAADLDRARDRLQGPGGTWCASCSATTSPRASGPIWGFGDGRSCATCSRARRSRACGSSPAASRNAASTRKYSALQIKAGEEGLLP